MEDMVKNLVPFMGHCEFVAHRLVPSELIMHQVPTGDYGQAACYSLMVDGPFNAFGDLVGPENLAPSEPQVE